MLLYVRIQLYINLKKRRSLFNRGKEGRVDPPCVFTFTFRRLSAVLHSLGMDAWPATDPAEACDQSVIHLLTYWLIHWVSDLSIAATETPSKVTEQPERFRWCGLRHRWCYWCTVVRSRQVRFEHFLYSKDSPRTSSHSSTVKCSALIAAWFGCSDGHILRKTSGCQCTLGFEPKTRRNVMPDGRSCSILLLQW